MGMLVTMCSFNSSKQLAKLGCYPKREFGRWPQQPRRVGSRCFPESSVSRGEKVLVVKLVGLRINFAFSFRTHFLLRVSGSSWDGCVMRFIL